MQEILAQYQKMVGGITLILLIVGVRALWRAAWRFSARTAQSGGDHFILDRDFPEEKRR